MSLESTVLEKSGETLATWLEKERKTAGCCITFRSWELDILAMLSPSSRLMLFYDQRSLVEFSPHDGGSSFLVGDL